MEEGGCESLQVGVQLGPSAFVTQWQFPRPLTPRHHCPFLERPVAPRHPQFLGACCCGPAQHSELLTLMNSEKQARFSMLWSPSPVESGLRPPSTHMTNSAHLSEVLAICSATSWSSVLCCPSHPQLMPSEGLQQHNADACGIRSLLGEAGAYTQRRCHT